MLAMWKQDIGQWVERKGRKGWTKQPQVSPPQPCTYTSGPQRLPVRVGFVPEGFEEKGEHPAVFSTASAASHADQAAAAPSYAGQQWVTVYGVSPTSILDVRESLDVMFGRTLMHKLPTRAAVPSGGLTSTSVVGHSSQQNWFYVKFEDPVAAARAVYQSPLIVSAPSTNNLHRAAVCGTESKVQDGRVNGASREEAVGIAWCTDELFLQEQLKQERLIKSLEGRREGSENNYCGETLLEEGGEGVRNTAGATPCGADRLQKASLTPFVVEGRPGLRSAASSRGLGSLIREALCSPWSARWTASPAHTHDRSDADTSGCGNTNTRGSSSPSSTTSTANTQVFHENGSGGLGATVCKGASSESNRNGGVSPLTEATIPSCLLARGRRYHHDAEHQIRSAQPTLPLPGNYSVLCAFKADVTERGLFKRVIRGILYIPCRVKQLLVKGDERTVNNNANFTESGEARFLLDVVSQGRKRRAMIRNRHYGAASRLHSVDDHSSGQVSTPVLAEWAPTRWHESSSLYSLFVILLLIIISRTVNYADMRHTFTRGRGEDVLQSSKKIVDRRDGPTGSSQQPFNEVVPNVLLIDRVHGSDKYRAKTL